MILSLALILAVAWLHLPAWTLVLLAVIWIPDLVVSIMIFTIIMTKILGKEMPKFDYKKYFMKRGLK